MYFRKEPIDFQTDVVQASNTRPVVVDFWAAWCGPCRMLSPTLEKLAEEAGDAWSLVKVNTELQPDIAGKHGIRGIPTVKLFIHGRVAAEFVGALPETQVRRWLDGHLPNPIRESLATAEAALQKGDAYTAMLKSREVLGLDGVDVNLLQHAKIVLAEASLSTDPEESRRLAAEFEVGEPFYERAEAVLEMYDLHYAELPEVDTSPACRLYVEGIQAWRGGDAETALEKLIESVREDRHWMEDAARKAVIAVFQTLGEDHNVTRKYRPSFASALF